MFLMATLLGAAAYAIFFAEEKDHWIIICLVILAVVTTFGRFLHKQAALMNVTVNMLLREQKTEEQRTLMSTRHTTVSATKKTNVNTNPTNPTTKKQD